MSFSQALDITQRLERAKMDAIFFADVLNLSEKPPGKSPKDPKLEPLTTVAALSVLTESIGLIATASTSFTEPYNLARSFSTVDHMSNGRVGWNIVTSFVGGENYNGGLLGHEERYRRADEFVHVAEALWDSWDDDAIVNDVTRGYWANADKIHRVEHHGEFFDVEGPLNIPRSPQGRPVLVQAGTSATGMELAAKYAEVIFTVQPELSSAQKFYAAIRTRIEEMGRDPGEVTVLPGLVPIIGDTESEALALADELSDLIDFEVDRGAFQMHMPIPLEDLDLDEVIPKNRLPSPEAVQGNRSRYELFYNLTTKDGYTLRQLMKVWSAGTGHFSVVGTAEQVADEMVTWFSEGGSDGFNLYAPYLPGGLDAITDQLIPILQARGVFREEYFDEETLRERFNPSASSRRTATSTR